MRIVALFFLYAADAAALRIAVFGGTGLVGLQTCKTLVACGCEVTSISRNGDATIGSKFENESWLSQVNFVKADAAIEGSAAAALADGIDGAVSCIGTANVLELSDDGWLGRWAWSERSKRMYEENWAPNDLAVKIAKAAGAKRFVYVGASSDAEQGFAGPNPGLYTAKRDVALAARDAFGDGFTYIGPHLVVEKEDDARIKFTNSGLGKSLMSVNDFLGGVRNFGEDYTTKTRLTPPVPVADVARAIVASAMGKVEVEESVRSAGITVLSETNDRDQYMIEDLLRHVDGTQAIAALAQRAKAAGVTG